MDAICIKHFDFSEDFVFATQRNRDGMIMATTCIIKAPKESDFINALLKECDKQLNHPENIVGYFNGIKKVKWGIIGPGLLHRMIQEHQLQYFLKSPEIFCHINYFEPKDFIKPRGYLAIQDNMNIYATHIWNAVWVDFEEKIDKNAKYDKDSVMEILKSKYINGYQNNTIVSDFSWFIKESKVRIRHNIRGFLNIKNRLKNSLKKRLRYVKNWRHSS